MKWITVQEAAGIAQLSKGIVYSAIRRGQLRASRIGAGRTVRTTEAWVSEWLSASASGGPPPTEAAEALRKSA